MVLLEDNLNYGHSRFSESPVKVKRQQQVTLEEAVHVQRREIPTSLISFMSL
jgi:hypothetical protein